MEVRLYLQLLPGFIELVKYMILFVHLILLQVLS